MVKDRKPAAEKRRKTVQAFERRNHPKDREERPFEKETKSQRRIHRDHSGDDGDI